VDGDDYFSTFVRAAELATHSIFVLAWDFNSDCRIELACEDDSPRAKLGTYLNDHYVNKEGSMDAGAWAEAKTGSRVLGGVAAAGYAVGSAAYHAPEAAVDYVKNNVTLNPSEVDWDRTLKPWKWF